MLVSTAMKWQRYINIALKIVLVLLLLHVVFYPELNQYQEKGMRYRLIGYPLVAFIFYIYHRLIKKSAEPYPFFQDILISLVIVIDMLGNALGFYGSIGWWDDVMHLLNCALLTPMVHDFQTKNLLKNRLSTAINTIGLLAWLQVLWEIAEYITFITTNSYEIGTAYRDTIGDLVFGQIGSMLAIVIVYKHKSYFPLKQPNV